MIGNKNMDILLGYRQRARYNIGTQCACVWHSQKLRVIQDNLKGKKVELEIKQNNVCRISMSNLVLELKKKFSIHILI